MFFSADTHLCEPSDLFTRHLPRVDHYRAPVWHRLPDETKLWTVNGVVVSISPEYRRSADELIGPDDVDGFLADLDADGVWGGVVHPNLGLMVCELDDPAFALRCARIYNEHVGELYLSDRLHPMAVIPLHDVDDAVAEMERVAAAGYRGIELPMTAPPDAPWFSHRHDPIWAAAQDLGLLVSMHVGTGFRRAASSPSLAASAVSFLAPTGSAQWPAGHPDHLEAIVARKTAIGGFGGYGGEAAVAIPALVGGGVLARFPDLHVLLVEVGARWLLNLMDTMDDAWHVGPGVTEVNRTFLKPDGTRVEQFLPDELGLEWPHPLPPSEYVRRQVHVTFQDDWVALRNRHLTGIAPLVWGNDYPHNEGCWPCSATAIEQQTERAGLSPDERAAIFGGTLAGLLGVAVPAGA